jgi:hypothetical protein
MEITSSSGEDYVGTIWGSNGVDQHWIFDQDMDLVEQTVQEFRGQRLSMVQSLRQYVLCYETILEWMALQSASGSKLGRERSGSDAGVLERGILIGQSMQHR